MHKNAKGGRKCVVHLFLEKIVKRCKKDASASLGQKNFSCLESVSCGHRVHPVLQRFSVLIFSGGERV